MHHPASGAGARLAISAATPTGTHHKANSFRHQGDGRLNSSKACGRQPLTRVARRTHTKWRILRISPVLPTRAMCVSIAGN